MGRSAKQVLDSDGVDVREFGYYSTPDFVASFLQKELLRCNPKAQRVFDPAVGREELTQGFLGLGLAVDGFDIERWKDHYECDFTQADFLEWYMDRAGNDSVSCLPHDIIIANPPYNCHELGFIRKNKSRLKKAFPVVGAHNMYSMFLAAMIAIAKEGAVLGVIISDSFLTATMHSGLRELIREECSIHLIALCPADLFRSQGADVRTCIMVLQKGRGFQKNVEVSKRPRNKGELSNVLGNRLFAQSAVKDVFLTSDRKLNQIVIDLPREIRSLFKRPMLGELFPCVTGVSTGNDKKYLSPVKREGYSVPFFKNPASRKFNASADAYLIDDYLVRSTGIPDFMVRNKQFLGKEGVVCSSMGISFSACYLPEDGVTGVNAAIFPPREDIYWLMAYLNSSLSSFLVRGVLIRSNMVTSGYVSSIPIPTFSASEKQGLARIAQDACAKEINVLTAITEVDRIVFTALQMAPAIQGEIMDFTKNIERRV